MVGAEPDRGEPGREGECGTEALRAQVCGMWEALGHNLQDKKDRGKMWAGEDLDRSSGNRSSVLGEWRSCRAWR